MPIARLLRAILAALRALVDATLGDSPAAGAAGTFKALGGVRRRRDARSRRPAQHGEVASERRSGSAAIRQRAEEGPRHLRRDGSNRRRGLARRGGGVRRALRPVALGGRAARRLDGRGGRPRRRRRPRPCRVGGVVRLDAAPRGVGAARRRRRPLPRSTRSLSRPSSTACSRRPSARGGRSSGAEDAPRVRRARGRAAAAPRARCSTSPPRAPPRGRPRSPRTRRRCRCPAARKA